MQINMKMDEFNYRFESLPKYSGLLAKFSFTAEYVINFKTLTFENSAVHSHLLFTTVGSLHVYLASALSTWIPQLNPILFPIHIFPGKNSDMSLK